MLTVSYSLTPEDLAELDAEARGGWFLRTLGDTGKGPSRGARVGRYLASLLFLSQRTLVWKSGDRGSWRRLVMGGTGLARTAMASSASLRSRPHRSKYLSWTASLFIRAAERRSNCGGSRSGASRKTKNFSCCERQRTAGSRFPSALFRSIRSVAFASCCKGNQCLAIPSTATLF